MNDSLEMEIAKTVMFLQDTLIEHRRQLDAQTRMISELQVKLMRLEQFSNRQINEVDKIMADNDALHNKIIDVEALLKK